jgi:putative transposase
MQKIYADGGYRGEELAEKLKKELNYDLEITLRSDKTTEFKPLPKRWVVERSFAWLNGFRRLSKDYEKLTENCEAMIMVAFICLMLNNKKTMKFKQTLSFL